MRYFEIAKPPARHILNDIEPKEAVPGEPRGGTIGTARERGTEAFQAQRTSVGVELVKLINRPSHRRHLSPRRSR
jgi:hypothetical protein